MCTESIWRPGTSGTPQVSTLGPIVPSICVMGQRGFPEAGWHKVGGVADTPEAHAANPGTSTGWRNGLPSMRDLDLLEKVQQETTKVRKETEHLSYDGSLRELGLPSLEKKRLRTSHQHTINIWNVGAKQSQVFSSDSQCQYQRQWHKHRRLPMSTRKHFFTVSTIKHRQKLPRKAGELPSLEILKRQDMILGKLLWLTMPKHRGWNTKPPEPFPILAILCHSVLVSSAINTSVICRCLAAVWFVVFS